MLVCNVSLRPQHRAIAAELAEIAAAVDDFGTGNIVFATLVDDPASVGDYLDAYSGEIMLEAASAIDVVTSPMVYAATVVEAVTAADTQTGTFAIAYTGPGDIVSGASAWWGLRAYTTASIGSNLVRLRRSSDSAEQDFASDSTGALDVAAISSFAGADTLAVVKLYDQTGNGFDLVQSTTGFQPVFALASLGALPTYNFSTSGSGTYLKTAGNMTVPQPFTYSLVANYQNKGSQHRILEGNDRTLGFNLGGNNQAFMFVGNSVPTVTVSANAWHAYQAIYNHAVASSIYIDGTSTAMNLGATSGISAYRFEHQTNSGGFVGDVKCGEAGIWSVAFNSTQQSAMNSNQHAYWGF